jgi:hypothetical protein
MGDGKIFSIDFRASLFHDELSNVPNFGQIHLARQYLKVKKKLRLKQRDWQGLSPQYYAEQKAFTQTSGIIRPDPDPNFKKHSGSTH